MIRVLLPSFSDDLLNECFTSMEAMQPGSTAAVIVGDNGLTAAFLNRWRQPRYVEVPKDPFCWVDAINRCARVAGEEDSFLILQDDTAVLTPHWLARCNLLMDAWPSEYGVLDLCQPTTAEVYGRSASVLVPIECPTTIAFTGVLIPSWIWTLVGELDPRFVGYSHDDTDYCVRLLHLGYKIGITGAAMIRHTRGTVGFERRLGQDGVREQAAVNHDLFYQKWGHSVPRPIEMKFLPAAPHLNQMGCGCHNVEKP